MKKEKQYFQKVLRGGRILSGLDSNKNYYYRKEGGSGKSAVNNNDRVDEARYHSNQKLTFIKKYLFTYCVSINSCFRMKDIFVTDQGFN